MDKCINLGKTTQHAKSSKLFEIRYLEGLNLYPVFSVHMAHGKNFQI